MSEAGGNEAERAAAEERKGAGPIGRGKDGGGFTFWAWTSVRGKPSRMKPVRHSGFLMPSAMRPIWRKGRRPTGRRGAIHSGGEH